MTKMKMMILAAMLLAAGLTGKAEASIAVSTVSFAGVTMISAPATGQKTYLKACVISNNTANDACLDVMDQSAAGAIDTTKRKLTICAKAGTTAFWPPFGANSLAVDSPSAVASFLGEAMPFSNAVVINTGRLDSSKLLSDVTCSYAKR